VTAQGDPVPRSHDILRLPKPPRDFEPDGYRPSSQDFMPSTADREHAARHRHPIRISVWDATMTSHEEALAFRNGPSLVLRGAVGAVLDAGASAVVYEPLQAPESVRPGAAGHAGIEGMPREPDETRPAYRDRLAAIAACFRLVV
jgi:hypothetical protein